MIEIIPAVNAETFEEVKKRLKMVEPFVEWAQLDVADGTFTKNTTWHEASDLLSLETPLKIEAHLMINDIEERVENWLIAPVKRIIFHLEAARDPDFVIEKCRAYRQAGKKAGKEVGIAIGPDTPWTQLVPYLDKVDLIQILGVYPGLAGQKFQEECFDKIMHLRKECPKCIIEVDGGMEKMTAKKAIEAGANIINAATAIFGAKDIKKAIEELENV
jgi:ribulose-phosphate 3-epimerase